MDRVFSAQYLTMKDSFSRQGIDIEAAFTPAGNVHHIHAARRLLAVDRGDNIQRLQATLPGLRRADPGEQAQTGDLVLLSIDEAEEGNLTVPEALDLIDERLGEDNPALAGGEPLVTPVHIVHIAKICPAGEPEVPSGYPTQPWPAPRAAVAGQDGVRLGVCDTGLLEDAAQHPWLADVTGETDPLEPRLLGGPLSIPQYAGHGTFVAGVARCMAPGATVYVNNHFDKSGGELEHVIIDKLEQLIQEAVVTVPRALIAETIDLIAVLAGRGGERRLVELAAVEGLGAGGDYVLTPAIDRASAGERA